MTNICARCNHAEYEHGDRAIILCSGGWARDRSKCYCTGFADTLAEV